MKLPGNFRTVILYLLCLGVTVAGAVRARAQLPDLAPVAILNVPATVSVNQAVPVACVVTNQGNGSGIGTWYDSIYLSTNTALSGSDRPLTYVTVNQGVATASSYTWATTVTIPAGTPGGLYHLFVVADDPYEGGSQLSETNKANNTSSIAITVQVPDLAPVAILNVPATVSVDQTVPVACVVTNQGNGNGIGGWYDTIYLSTNTVLSGSDRPLTYVTVNQGVAAGGSYTWATSVAIPAGTPGGLYHLFVVADDPYEQGTQLSETNKVNNTSSIAITVQMPDLAPVAILNVPSTVSVDQAVPVACVVTNQGNGNGIGTWYDTIYLSTNTVLSGSDRPLTYVPVNQGVAAAGSYTWATSVAIPAGTPGGLYHLFVVADDPYEQGTQLSETNKVNNTSSIAITVQMPDLAPVAILNVPTTVSVNQTVPVVCVVTNQGNGIGIGGWYDTIYLSSNTVLSASDRPLNYVPVNQGVAVAGSYTWATSVMIPAGTPGGVYHLFVVADDPYEQGTQLAEDTKANNTNSVAVTVQVPDLAPVAILDVPALALPGQTVPVACVVTNQGNGNGIGGWYDTIYLSTNTVLSGSDRPLTYVTVSQGVAAGGSYAWGTSVTIPQAAGGLYHLFVVADDPYEGGTQLAEVTKANNTNSVLISFETPDLTATNLSVSNAMAIAGKPLTVSWTIMNISTNSFTGDWYDGLTLSSNSTLNGAITNWDFLGHHVALAGGGFSETETVTLPGVAATNYWLIVQADDRNSVPESNKSNNTVAIEISVISVPPTNVSLLTPTNNLTQTTCIPVSFPLASQAQAGSYAIAYVRYYDGSTPIGQSSNAPNYPADSPPLSQGTHSITAQAVDAFMFTATSPVATVTLKWPNTNDLLINTDTNRNCVVCMGAQSNQSYLVETATNLANPAWQPYLTNPVVVEPIGEPILIFTNHPTLPQLDFRVELVP